MKVNIKNLEKIISLLLLKLRERKGDVIDIKNDFYWDIDIQELYNPYNDPKTITLGQLSDDLKELERSDLVDDAIPYDIKRIGHLLIALSLENQTSF